MNGQEGKRFSPTGAKSDQLLLSANFLDGLEGSTGNVLANPQITDNLDYYDYGRKRIANASGIEGDTGLRPKTKNKGSSITPKIISGKNDTKEDLPESKAVMNLFEPKNLIKYDLIEKSDTYATHTYGSKKHNKPARVFSIIMLFIVMFITPSPSTRQPDSAWNYKK